MNDLSYLAQKYGTDKLQHGYIPYYEKHLPKEPGRLLEIGCFKGASLRMWREYFPAAELHTIDLFHENKQPDDIFNLHCHKGSQSDLNFLKSITQKFDVIIDDGSHNSEDQIISFERLFHHNLIPGGVYVCEDLHCCKEEFYRNGLHFSETLLGHLKSGNFPFPFQLFDDKIAFIFKS